MDLVHTSSPERCLAQGEFGANPPPGLLEKPPRALYGGARRDLRVGEEERLSWREEGGAASDLDLEGEAGCSREALL